MLPHKMLTLLSIPALLGKVSQKNVAVLFDFVQMRGGGGVPKFLSPFHKSNFGQ